MTIARDLIVGWARIAKRIGVASEDTARAYARLNTDPLPVRLWNDQPRALGQYLDEWRRRREGGDGLAVLEGGADVMAALGIASSKTLYAWAKLPRDPLPLIGYRPGRRAPVRIYACALRDWIDRRDIPFAVSKRSAA